MGWKGRRAKMTDKYNELIDRMRRHDDIFYALYGWRTNFHSEVASAISELCEELGEALKYVPKECSTCAHWLRRAPGKCECGAPEELGPCDLGARQIWAWKGVKHDD